MKKLVTFLILIAAGAGGGLLLLHGTARQVEPPQVTQVTISQGDIIEVGAGDRHARADADASTSARRCQASSQEIFVDYNYIVKKGQVLAKIDPTLLQVQVDIQKANIERQKGDIENQKVQLEDSKTNLERTQELFDKGLANQQQLEAAELTVKIAQAQIDSAQKQLVSRSEAQSVAGRS